MPVYEFCATLQDKHNNTLEQTLPVQEFARNEHEARRRIVQNSLSAGFWVVLLLTVEDLTT